MESPTLSERAWGVRLSTGIRLAGLESRLIAELRACQKHRDAVTDGPEYAYIQSLFDSLIELEAEVPAEEVMPYRSRWKAEVIILISNGRRNVPALLEMHAERTDDLEWLALSNRLLELRSGELFERMLNGLPVTHKFVVVDRAYAGGWAVGHGNGSPASPPKRAFPPGFPPISLYRLTLGDGGGAVLLADGPRKLFFRRVLIPADGEVEWPAWTYPGLEASRLDCKLEYLARLGKRPLDEVRNMFQRETRIHWRTLTELTREIEKKLDDQAFDIRHFIIGTKLRGHSDASLIRVEIKPTLTDLRQQQIGRLAQPKPSELVLDLR